MMDYHKMEAFGGAPQMERGGRTTSSSSDGSQESSFIEERRARVMRDRSSTSQSSRDSSVLSTASSFHSQQFEELQQLHESMGLQLRQQVLQQLHPAAGLYPYGGRGDVLFPLNEDAVSLDHLGDVSLAEDSLHSVEMAPQNEGARPPIEFRPMLPPTTIPGLAPSPLLAPITARHFGSQMGISARHSDHFAAPRAPRIRVLDQHEMAMAARAEMMGREQMMHPHGYWLHPAGGMHPAEWQRLCEQAFIEQCYAREQNETLLSRGASRTRRNTSISSDGSTSSSQSLDCSYCRSVAKNPLGHNKHNCPILATLPPCRNCGKGGKYNHTESHCPEEKKIDLQFIPKDFRRRSHNI